MKYKNLTFWLLRSSLRTDEEEYKEQLREKWEQERVANIDKTDIHYADIKYDGKN